MFFEWDENKNLSNIRKHKVSFDQAKDIFSVQTTIFVQDEVVDGEQRWKAIGTYNGISYLLVIHTYHSDNGDEYVRIISARKLSTGELKRWLL